MIMNVKQLKDALNGLDDGTDVYFFTGDGCIVPVEDVEQSTRETEREEIVPCILLSAKGFGHRMEMASRAARSAVTPVTPAEQENIVKIVTSKLDELIENGTIVVANADEYIKSESARIKRSMPMINERGILAMIAHNIGVNYHGLKPVACS